jgi:hypothetical protein
MMSVVNQLFYPIFRFLTATQNFLYILLNSQLRSCKWERNPLIYNHQQCNARLFFTANIKSAKIHKIKKKLWKGVKFIRCHKAQTLARWHIIYHLRERLWNSMEKSSYFDITNNHLKTHLRLKLNSLKDALCFGVTIW